MAGWGHGTAGPPSCPTRTPLLVHLHVSCPTSWCEPSALETTVVTWQPSPSNHFPTTWTQWPRGKQVGREGQGPGVGELGPPFSPGSSLSLSRPPNPCRDPDLSSCCSSCSLCFSATFQLPHHSASTRGPHKTVSGAPPNVGVLTPRVVPLWVIRVSILSAFTCFL